MYEVCAFNSDFAVKKDIHLDKKEEIHLTQLLAHLKGETLKDKLSIEVQDLIFLLQDELTYLFVCALLFINIDKKIIEDYSGIPIKSIELFEKLLFRIFVFRGKISKIGFFKRLIVSDDIKSQNLGIILKAAHTFGKEYIKWKFGLNETNMQAPNILNNTFQDMYFKYLEKSYKLKDSEVIEHIKAGKQIISAAVDIQRASNMNSGSSSDDIKKYLIELQKETEDLSWNQEVEIVDIEEFNNIKEQNGS